MTLGTVATQLSAVGILVTIHATELREPESAVGFVASLTTLFLVGAFERKLCPLVVEAVGVQTHNVGLSAMMIAMASDALDRLSISNSSVKPTIGIDVPGDALMTIETEWCLVVLIEMHVTHIAIGLDFRVGFNELSRHQ